MEIVILNATMTHSKEDGYVGNVQFQVDGHKAAYEITLYRKNGKEWMYGLHFHGESGDEEELFALEDLIDDNDEVFGKLVEAAKSVLAE
jgi:hypothetical protein